MNSSERKVVLNSAELLSIERFLADTGVTQCPPVYLCAIAGATPMKESVPDTIHTSESGREKYMRSRNISYKNHMFKRKLETARTKKKNRI